MDVAARTIASELGLPCGARLKNRLVKAAMTEGLADADNRATERHVRLYRRWAASGAALLLTGNVMVDRRYLERPGNVAIDGPQSAEQLAALRAWAAASTADGTHLWMQLSHAGRQTPEYVAKTPVAPSDKQLKMPGERFGKPRALTEPEIENVIERFAHAAAVARETGFTGVQIHAAHGYLLSEFLSPDVNTRKDAWGGSLENRAHIVLATVHAVRAAVGADFPIGVKLNSADFQRGGFSFDEALDVARMLDVAGIDLLEISGGTYEQPRLLGLDVSINPDRAERPRASTIAREAYFLDYAASIRTVVKLPLMVTGGFRTAKGMNAALASGAVDAVGVARPFCVDPTCARGLLDGSLANLPVYELKLRIGSGFFSPASPLMLIKGANAWAAQGWFCLQLLRMGAGLEPDLRLGALAALLGYLNNERRAARALTAR